MPQGSTAGGNNQKTNDCEIVCVSRNQRVFAERIENRLKNLGLKVDVLFPNPKVDLNKIMGMLFFTFCCLFTFFAVCLQFLLFVYQQVILQFVE